MTSDSMTSKTASGSRRSLFAASISDLIEQTEIFSRSEWATTLGVTGAAISQWINDKTVPRPRTLRSLIEVVRRYRGADNRYLKAFLAIVDRPAHTVSPHGARLEPSVGRYLVSPVLEGFLRQLDTLSYSIQETVLLKAVGECERLREASEREPHGDRPEVKSIPALASVSPPPVSSSDPFIGRDAELTQVRNLLYDGTPVAVFGPTGAGKTALAAEVVRRLFGASPCQAIRRFEFKTHHDLPWNELRRYVAGCQDESGDHSGDVRVERQNIFFVFDDVDMAGNPQRAALADFLRDCTGVGPRLKVIVTYRSDRSPDVHSVLSAMRRSRSLATVYLPRLTAGDITQLWSVLLTNVAKTFSDNSVHYAAWLAAGSPGYCRQLAERARACSVTDLSITEYDVVEASNLLLNDTDGGLAALEALSDVSREAQSVAVWSAMQDQNVEAQEAGLPAFYREVNDVNAKRLPDLRAAIEEAIDNDLVESVSIGDRPAITLKNESHRPHFRSIALTRFKHVPEVLVGKEQAVALAT